MKVATLTHEPSRLSGFEAFATANVTRTTWTAYRVWGLINLLLLTVSLIVPPLGRIGGFFTQTRDLSILAWIILAGSSLRLWVSAPWPVRLIAIFQIWSCLCTLHADVKYGLATMDDIGRYPITLIAIFAFSTLLSQVDPDARSWFKRAYLGVLFFSAIFSLMQFVGVGPARRLVATYQSVQPIVGDNYFRSVGLLAFGGWAITNYTMGAVLLAGPVLTRRLTAWETMGSFLLLVCAILPQQRAFYAEVVLASLILLGLFLHRMRGTAVRYLVGLAILSVVVGPVAVPKLGYALQTGAKSRESLNYRQTFGWPQAYRAIREEPVFGKGPNNQFLIYTPLAILHTRHFSGTIIDNAYLTTYAMYGLPGMLLFIAIMVTGTISAALCARDKNTDPLSRSFALVIACILPGLMMVMSTATVFNVIQVTGIIVLMAGFAVPTFRERQLDSVRRFGARRHARR